MKMLRLLLTLTLLSCFLNVSSQNLYDIVEFGAKNDINVISTAAIQSAIDVCSQNGGGVVVVPAGEYKSGTLVFKKNVSLQLQEGSTLYASSDLNDYYAVGEKNRKVFLFFDRVEGISITGSGKIDGNGEAFWDKDFKALERPEPFILFRNSKRVKIRDISIVQSPSHTLRMEKSEDFVIDGISIITDPRGPNTDGINIVDSHTFRITNCYMSSWDDLICLKSQSSKVENVVVTNCILESEDAAIKFGTGSRVGTNHNIFDNLVIRNTRYGIALFMLDGGEFQNNRFSNMIIETGGRHQHTYPIFIDIDKRVDNRGYGTIDNLKFENLQIITSGKILISGHESQSINRLIMQDVDVKIKDPADFSASKKPRGNKNYPSLKSSVDLSRQSAHMIFGNIDTLILEDVEVFGDKNTRDDFYFLDAQVKE
jgi:parallel beta-helix repeat protein